MDSKQKSIDDQKSGESLPTAPNLIEAAALDTDATPDQSPGTESRGVPMAKIFGLVAGALIGLLLLYLFFGASKGEDNNNEKKPNVK